MSETFLHGVEVIEIDTGPRRIQTAKSSVIGLVGTAPMRTLRLSFKHPCAYRRPPFRKPPLWAQPAPSPLRLTASLTRSALWLSWIRVEARTQPRLISCGVDAGTGDYTGVHALLASRANLV